MDAIYKGKLRILTPDNNDARITSLYQSLTHCCCENNYVSSLVDWISCNKLADAIYKGKLKILTSDNNDVRITNLIQWLIYCCNENNYVSSLVDWISCNKAYKTFNGCDIQRKTENANGRQ